MSSQISLATEQLNSHYYLRMVTTMGDGKPVYSTRDIYSVSGIKLLGSGTPVNSAIYEKLMNHKLVPKLDDCLTSEDTLTNAQLTESCRALLDSDRTLGPLIANTKNQELLLAIPGKIPLSNSVAFKLGVMRNQRPELYEHSIFITLVSIYLGICARLSEDELLKLATAALLHDIGILHIDPGLLDRAHRMSAQERRHLYIHPLSAWMILNEYPQYSGDVARAVLEHHERLDGSGYPRGLSDHQIGMFGQIIAVAEIVASRHIREAAQCNQLRLETMLKLNSRRYGREYVGYLHVFYGKAENIPALSQNEMQLLRQRLYAIAAILAAWETTRTALQGHACGEFIDDHIHALNLEMVDAGVNIHTVESNILGMEDNAQAGAEARILLDEVSWRLRELIEIVHRRWPSIDEAPLTNPVLTAWIADLESSLTAS